jgi:magnesium transporter
MIKDPITVSVETSLDELHDIFDSHRFVGIPVVDSNNRMRGIVRRSDVLEAEGDKSDSDYLKSAGILGGEELRTMPLLLRSKRRLSWLTINIFLNIFAASIIALYQDTLQAVIALAVFLPIISDMSGCSGSQAVAVSVRELTLGLVRGRDILRVWRKEVFVGLINGTILGCLIGLVAWFWQGNPFLGLVVGVALAVNTVVAVSIGGVVPLLLTKLGKDPALASGPILTTVTDMFGFFAVLSLAQLALPWLI